MKTRNNKRQDILDGALALLAREGLEGFTASALAKQSGVSKATLFHHFPTMNDIVLEAFEQFALGMEMMAPPKGTGLRDWLIGMGDASFGLEETGNSLARAYFVFVSKSLFDERLRLKVKNTVESVSQAFGDIMVRLCSDMDAAEARALGNLVFITADGMAIHLQAFPERRVEILRAWRLFVACIAPQ